MADQISISGQPRRGAGSGDAGPYALDAGTPAKTGTDIAPHPLFLTTDCKDTVSDGTPARVGAAVAVAAGDPTGCCS
jgi:hypothetical protein